ncbi:protein-methionine-sulfoxide reductase heme-binding subunit MsrQ [Deinococcus sp. VB142]|uniref:Protein-methionine-sulfoxide reductase heme-binding subunit MsrQ n=1 Tax=Deinococcus sp. VB142 TaxID=3112952 RepID=A0AAU6PZL7_9DEIO
MTRRKAPPLPWLPPGVIVGGLLPAFTLLLDALADRLGADPVKQAIHQSGQLAIILLLLSLACTPLRRFLGWTWPARIRKPLGLLAFFYAGMHFALYLRSQDFSLRSAVQDVTERPFITSGFAALLLLLPLALTSTPGSVRRLGFAAWTRLHRLVYLAAGLAALHYWWGVKQDKTGPLTVILILAGLLLSRLGSTRPRRAR